MTPVTEWRIYYDNGTVFTHADGPPEAAPPYGVIAILQNGENTILASQDFYIYREDYKCWIEVHIEGLIDHIVTSVHYIKAVKAGRTVPLSVFKNILKDVNVDAGRFYGNC